VEIEVVVEVVVEVVATRVGACTRRCRKGNSNRCCNLGNTWWHGDGGSESTGGGNTWRCEAVMAIGDGSSAELGGSDGNRVEHLEVWRWKQ